MRIAFSLSLALLYLSGTALSAVVSRPGSTYDYVIVGGGAAGCIVASRLTENPKVSVLLVEAGPTNEGILNIEVPYNFNNLSSHTPFDWNFTITPQVGLAQRSLPYFRGHVLGGSTSVNGMTYTRGPSSDYDRIAAYLGDKSWTWDNLQPYIRRNEDFEPPVGPNATTQYNPEVHGYNGPIGVSVNEVPEWIYNPLLTAARDAGFPYNRDVNSGQPLGVSWEQFAIKNGSRSSAATGFINSQVRNRSNLDVLVNTRVQRLVAGNPRSPLMLTTIQYTDSNGRNASLTAKKEVIVSAGTMNTPPLLMRSGLGDPAALRAAGITPLLNVSQIGKNLQDHIGIALAWTVNVSTTDDPIYRDPSLYNRLLGQWNRTRTGRLTQTGFSHMFYSRVPANASILRTIPDPSSGTDAPHYELLLANKWTGLSPTPPTGNYIGFTYFVTSPTSKGTVTLNASDPYGAPIIDPRYLTTDWDIYVLRTAIRRSLNYMKSPVWRQYNLTATFDTSIGDTDEKLDSFIRTHAYGGVHCVSTAKMGPANSPNGTDVVGPDFRIKGVQGVRIVDASVIPFEPGAHTMAPVYILAEKASDVIAKTSY